ncbi:chemotaxis protein CheX [Spirochaeta dissipatitropha]
MTELQLRAFIRVLVEYFEEVSSEGAQMGIPYMREGETILLEYTGLIGISGAQRGGIYITADESMLRELASVILGPGELSTEDVVDMVGELTNTVAGNVRRSFGSGFMISVPIVLRGRPEDILMKLRPPVFVVPIQWHGHKLYLSVGLE